MATNRGKQLLNKEYNKEVARVKRLIKQAEKKGLTFTEPVLPKQPKVITEGSIRKLQKISKSSVFSKAITPFVETSTTPSSLKSLKGKKSSAKDSKTTLTTRHPATVEKADRVLGEGGELHRMLHGSGEHAQPHTDNVTVTRDSNFNIGNIIYRRIKGILDDHRETSPSTVEIIERELEDQINLYGDDFFRSLTELEDEVIERIEKLMTPSYTNVYALSKGLLSLMELIRGEILNIKERRAISDRSTRADLEQTKPFEYNPNESNGWYDATETDLNEIPF